MQGEPFSDELTKRLARARSVVVLTGAGISAESGIATFRDAGGIWSKFRPEELANVEAFLANPDLVQGWYRERKRIASEAQPNPGHEALVTLEAEVEDFTLITQNVDNLHRRAGSQNVVELHGNITRSYCIDCNASYEEQGEQSEPDLNAAARCEDCGGLIRPDVVWFGELLPADAIEQAFQAARRASVCLSIGTSAVVYPAADVPLAARTNGAYVAEINVEPSAIAAMLNETVLGRSGKVLPCLADAALQARQSMNQQAS